MCDYSIYAKSRPAVVGEELITCTFGTGTAGFASPGKLDDRNVGTEAVCLLPGTELAFDKPVIAFDSGRPKTHGKTARFRQINKDQQRTHHDMLEFADGSKVLLTHLALGLRARVLQLPAKPKTAAEREEQRRAEYTG